MYGNQPHYYDGLDSSGKLLYGYLSVCVKIAAEEKKAWRNTNHQQTDWNVAELIAGNGTVPTMTGAKSTFGGIGFYVETE